MEVHQHLQHANKKWHQYFWEFFMMFAAVSASFFVENQREHYIERQKERQYMVSMLADLKYDTSSLKKYIGKNNGQSLGLDTLFMLIRNYRNDQAKELYRLFDTAASWVYRARLADRTISQLKSSGNMRLIHVQEVSDSILIYEEKKKLLLDQGESYRRESEILTDLSRKILDYQYLLPLTLAAVPSVQNLNKEGLFEFSNEVKVFRDQIDTYVDNMEELLVRAENLIALIGKKYHLK